MDSLILALGGTKSPKALPSLLRKLATLDPDVTLSHHRSIALALESIKHPDAARPLAKLLSKPGMANHACNTICPLYDKPVNKRKRIAPLREIVLARALLRCGDWKEIGRNTLETYRNDLRGLFAAHAQAVLKQEGQR